MDLSIDGHCKVPPGFRFHPTEEELLQYYLKKKVAQEMIELDVIPCVDLNKLEPWDIQERCKIGSGPQNEWYLFSRKDKKYPSGTRTNRATEVGFWKATGRDKIVYSNSKRIGLRKTLVFYLGRAPSGKKSDWIMYEYRLEDHNDDVNNVNNFGEFMADDWWVICRLFKKRNFIAKESPQYSSTSSNASNDQSHIFSTSKLKENATKNNNVNKFVSNNKTKLQPTISFNLTGDNDQVQRSEVCGYSNPNGYNHLTSQGNGTTGELALSQDGQNLKRPYLSPSTSYQASEIYSSLDDLWSFLDA